MSTTLSPVPSPSFILQNAKPLNCVQFSLLNKDILYAGNRNGDFTIYNLSRRRAIFSANSNQQPIMSIVELDETSVLTHSRNGAIFKWTQQSDTQWTSTSVYQSEYFSFCPSVPSLDKRFLFLPSSESPLIDCLEIGSFTKKNSLRPKSGATKRGMLMNLKIVDANCLLAGFENGEIVSFDLNTFKELSSVELFEGQPLMCLDFSLGNNFGIAGSSESTLKQFSLTATYDLIAIQSEVSLVNPGLNCLKIRPSDSKIVACGCWDSRLRLYGTKKKNLLVALDFHKEAIHTIDFSGTGLIACGSDDGIISFWNLYNN